MVSGVTYPNTLRTLYGSQGQMGLQLVAEMHISPVNGDTVWRKKAHWRFSLFTRLPFFSYSWLSTPSSHPHKHPPPILLSLSCLQPRPFQQRLKNSLRFMLVVVKCGQKPALCVRVCSYWAATHSTVLSQNIQSLTLNSDKVKIIYDIFIMKTWQCILIKTWKVNK